MQHINTADEGVTRERQHARPAAKEEGETLQYARPAAEALMRARHHAKAAGTPAQQQEDSHASCGRGVKAGKKGSKAGNRLLLPPC